MKVENMRQGGNGQVRNFFSKIEIVNSPVQTLYCTKVLDGCFTAAAAACGDGDGSLLILAVAYLLIVFSLRIIVFLLVCPAF